MSPIHRASAKKPRVLATDLDGTLIPLKGNQQNRRDLAVLRRHLEQQSVTLTYVTGRHLQIVEEAMIQHQLPPPDWIICDVGTTIYGRSPDGWQGHAIYHDHLGSICASLPYPKLREQISALDGLSLQEEEKQGEFKLSFYVKQRKLDEIATRVKDWLADRDAPWSLIHSIDPFTGSGLIDLLPCGISKAYAVEWWCDHHGFDNAEVIFAGDSGNDVAALTAGYRSIVVGNADSTLADRVAAHHNECGWTDRLHLAKASATSGVLEGCHAFGLFPASQVRLPLGATLRPEGKAEFAVWAPHCQVVDVQVETSDAGSLHRLESPGDGFFRATIDGVGPGSQYGFRLDETVVRPDPLSRYQPDGVHGLSQIVDPLAYDWQDEDWQGIAKSDLIIYELHVGTFTQVGTFRGAIERFEELRELGVTAIEVMPVAQASGRWNWGYDGVNLFAVSCNYGTPDEFRTFVDAAHASGLAVILDVVYNHVGPEGNYLAEFGPYFSTSYHTPWGEAFNFDGPDSSPVREFVIENALRWIEEYHLDGLRLDAVHCMIDESEEHVLDAIRRAVTDFAATVARPIHLIAETNRYDHRLLHPSGPRQEPYDGIWCDDLMHSIYSHVVPEVVHVQRPYQGADDLAESLQHGYIYSGPPERRVTAEQRRHFHPHGTGDDLASLVIALQNHDVVGNDAHGRRLQQLVSVETQKATAALVLLSPSIPLLFMGEESACSPPFHFFNDFGDEHLRQAVERGRAQEYPQHAHADFPSPLDPRVFAASKLRSYQDDELRAWYRALIRIRKEWQRTGDLMPCHLQVDCDPARGIFSYRYSREGGPPRFVLARLQSSAAELSTIPVTVDGEVLLNSQPSTSTPEASPERLTLTENGAIVGWGMFRVPS